MIIIALGSDALFFAFSRYNKAPMEHPVLDIERIRDHDVTLFSDDPAVQASIAQRLGWTTLPEQARALLPLLDELAEMAGERDIEEVVLIGMGGSSLATYVFEEEYADRAQRAMYVLDTTCPEEVAMLAERLDYRRTLFVVASKSGTTLETVTLEGLFWNLLAVELPDEAERASHFIALTDPGTPLAARAAARGYRLITSPPDVGGRFSAFSVFGLVTAALAGMDLRDLIEEACNAQQACASPTPDNPALLLATELWRQYQAGNNKLVLPNTRFSLWIEQLVAESLSKQGRGIIPLVGATACCCTEQLIACPQSPHATTPSLLATVGGLQSCVKHPNGRAPIPVSVPQAMVIWMWATALLGAWMGVNPFDEPDIATAKASVLHALEADDLQRLDDEEYCCSPSLASVLSAAPAEDYISILAYVDKDQFVRLRDEFLPRIAGCTNLACCLSKGPRYLHSIRQLHQGGPRTGLYLVIDNETPDAAYFEVSLVGQTLETLFDAQRIGDVQALRAIGRPVIMAHLDEVLDGRFTNGIEAP